MLAVRKDAELWSSGAAVKNPLRGETAAGRVTVDPFPDAGNTNRSASGQSGVGVPVNPLRSR
jgi:hypothetical protein